MVIAFKKSKFQKNNLAPIEVFFYSKRLTKIFPTLCQYSVSYLYFIVASSSLLALLLFCNPNLFKFSCTQQTQAVCRLGSGRIREELYCFIRNKVTFLVVKDV